MRNYLLSLLVALLAVTGSLPVAAQEAYAALTPDGTLTFYYDNQRATHQDHNRIYNMPEPENEPAWAGHWWAPQKDVKHVVFDNSFSEYHPSSTRSWFEYCINLQDIEGIRNLNTEKVTNMSAMFDGCKELKSLDVSNFNTQNVINMGDMFSGCDELTSLDVSKFNTDKVTSMSFMFRGCQALTSLDVSKFNTENVNRMSSMFSGCRRLTSLDVSNFNTEKVTDMSRMFSFCEALTSLDVSNFNTENVIWMREMFHYCKALTSIDVSNFNTEKVTDMIWMFYGCESLTTIFCNSDWNVDPPVYTKSMFNNCTKLKGSNTSFNGNKTGIEMANPTTGYFTSKTTGLTT